MTDNHTGIDTSAEAMAELESDLIALGEGVFFAEINELPKVQMDTEHARLLIDAARALSAGLIRAQSAEIERLRAERYVAWKAGAEAMRNGGARAAVLTLASRSDKAGIIWHDGFTSGCLHAADAIRALPLPAPPAFDDSGLDRHTCGEAQE